MVSTGGGKAIIKALTYLPGTQTPILIIFSI